jgi:acyl carrier protein
MQVKIHQVIADSLKIPVADITPELAYKDTETWDSLRHMELIGALEQSFGLEFTFDEIISMQCVADICRTLMQKGVGV